MRGSLWSVVVVGMLALFLGAVSISYDPGSASQQTLDIAGLLRPIGKVIGLTFLVVCTGGFLRWFSGGGF